ncbi:MAG: beta-lactamase family protein [Proteobacteria bacterium]|nr:beta-lactamase family protein [Pseudomonadota bacterium]
MFRKIKSPDHSRIMPVLVLAAGLIFACLWPSPTHAGEKAPNPEGVASLNAVLKPWLAESGLPALAAAAARNGRIVAAGAVGTRRAGRNIPVTVKDRFHIGSDTKAFTSLLAAIYVEQGRLRWETTVGEAFPELKNTMAPGLSGVTLLQLLSHSSGMPGDNERFVDLILESYRQEGNLDELRYWLVSQWVREPLVDKPGQVFAYSNMGYTMAGSIIERAGGATYEELITRQIFEPLGLKSAGFGPQSSMGKVDAPLGHVIQDGRAKAFLAGPNGDNPVIIGPAGTGHMSPLDFAAWAGWHAGEGKRGPALVGPATLKKLHAPIISTGPLKDTPPGTPQTGMYALGWGRIEPPWSSGPWMMHGGSNNKNLAHVLFRPDIDFAMVLMTNVGGEKAAAALHKLEEVVYKKYAPIK